MNSGSTRLEEPECEAPIREETTETAVRSDMLPSDGLGLASNFHDLPILTKL